MNNNLLKAPNIFYLSFFSIYAVWSILFYYLFVLPYLNTANILSPKLLADTITYQSICPDVFSWGEFYWLRDAGPCLSLYVFDYNSGLLTIFNAFMLLASCWFLARSYYLDTGKLLFWIIINPMTFFSIFGPNKEIFGIISTIWLLIYLSGRNIVQLILVLVFSLMTRISVFLTIVSFLLLYWTFLPGAYSLNTRAKRKLLLLSCLGVLVFSFIAYEFGGHVELQVLGDVWGAEFNSRSTMLSLKMEMFSQSGLYIISYLVRLFLGLYGALANFGVVQIDTHGAFYTIGVIGSSLIFFVLTGVFLRNLSKRKGWVSPFSLNIIVYFVLFTLGTCISPVIQHRYLFPLYPIILLFSVFRYKKNYPKSCPNYFNDGT